MVVKDNVKKYLQKLYNKMLITRNDIIKYCKKHGMKVEDWDYVSNEEMMKFIYKIKKDKI